MTMVSTHDLDGAVKQFPTVVEALQYAQHNNAVYRVVLVADTGEQVQLVRYSLYSQSFVYAPAGQHY